MARSAASSARRPRPRLGAEDWLAAAREALILGGVAAVKVEPLAAALGVTAGSFYWHFRNRPALLARLLEDWRDGNSAAMIAAATLPGATAEQRFDAFLNVWVTEAGYSSAYDSAVRDWARTSDEVRAAVHAVDLLRVALLERIFQDLGYDRDRAAVRARITYFHQVGFYALDLRDDEAARLRYRPLYFEALRDGHGRGGATASPNPAAPGPGSP